MARSVRSKLETRSARLRLPARKEPYWVTLERGLAVGYHRPQGPGAGTWWGRVRRNGRYNHKALAEADDHVDTGGRVLNWGAAQTAVREWSQRAGEAPLTVAGAVNAYVQDLRVRQGDKAASEVNRRLGKHLLPALGERRLADVTYAEWRSWQAGLVQLAGTAEEVRRSRDSANRTFGMARAAANLAFNNGLVVDDKPWRRVKQFKNVGTARKLILTEQELQRLLDASGTDLRPLNFVAAGTGARPGELRALNVRDFSGADATLFLHGKTGEREIFLFRMVVDLLTRLVDGRDARDPLFVTRNGRRWSRATHTRLFRAAVARAGLDPDTVSYSLRHTYISHALASGVPVKAVADYTGTSVGMLQKHYAKSFPDDRRRYVAMAAPALRIESLTE